MLWRAGEPVDCTVGWLEKGRSKARGHWPSSFADGGAVLMEMAAHRGNSTCLWWLCASHKLGKAVTSRDLLWFSEL